MASRLDRSKLITALAAVALSAACWWFGTRLQPIWWLVWLAPLPVLWLSTRVPARWAALAAFAAGGIGALNMWSYLRTLPLPSTTVALAIVVPALVGMFATLLYRRLIRRGRPLAATLSVPVLWTATGYLIALVSPHGTYGNLAYTQMNVLAVIQIAALTGLWGIGFVVMLAPAGIATLCSGASSRGARWHAALLAGGLIAVVLGFGVWRLQSGVAATNAKVKIGLLSLGGRVATPLSKPDGQQMLRRYTQALDQLAAQGVQIAVLPEFTFSTNHIDITALRELARRRGITVVTGIEYHGDPQAVRNMSIAFHPRGDTPSTYIKHHLLTSAYKPGTTYTMLPGTPRIGLAICKDMDFTALGHAYATRDAQLLLVPAQDFTWNDGTDSDGWMHGRMAILRGVEGGFAIARAARDGDLTLSDDRGRVLGDTWADRHVDASLVGTLPLRDTRTLYARWGDWFAWLDLAGLLTLLIMAWTGIGLRKRTS